MNLIPLSHMAVGNSLIRLGLPWLRDPDDTYRSRYTLPSGGTAIITYKCTPTHLVIRSLSPETVVGPSDWPVVLGMLNKWAQTHDQPRAYLDTRHGRIVTSTTIPLETGTHHSQLDELIDMNTQAAAAFHDWLLTELPDTATNSVAISVDELELLFLREDIGAPRPS